MRTLPLRRAAANSASDGCADCATLRPSYHQRTSTTRTFTGRRLRYPFRKWGLHSSNRRFKLFYMPQVSVRSLTGSWCSLVSIVMNISHQQQNKAKKRLFFSYDDQSPLPRGNKKYLENNNANSLTVKTCYKICLKQLLINVRWMGDNSLRAVQVWHTSENVNGEPSESGESDQSFHSMSSTRCKKLYMSTISEIWNEERISNPLNIDCVIYELRWELWQTTILEERNSAYHFGSRLSRSMTSFHFDSHKYRIRLQWVLSGLLKKTRLGMWTTAPKNEMCHIKGT